MKVENPADPPLSVIGLVSDTHDLLREEVLAELHGVDLILHTGDVCSPGILESLEEIAPVVAVRGNCDHGDWAESLPLRRTVELFGWRIHMVHDRSDLELDREDGVDLVLFGHSHKPTYEQIESGTVLFNPGSAGPRRFDLPIGVARLVLADSHFSLEQVEWEAT